MNILVIGSGGREHAIIKKLLQSEKNPTIFCTPGNGGIAKDATCLECDILDSNEVCKVASKIKADLVVVAPDDPLAKGVVDALNEKGFKTFGPNKAAAIIESSKAFSKDLMKKYNIPTAKYETFTNFEKAIEYIELNNVYPIVIKADGLALGKGVIIAENFENAKNAVDSMMNNKCFGESGNTVVIEEFLTGPEVSVLSFCDGKTVVPMISSMDHKRALDDDKGLNTGGMGTIAPNPYYTEEIANFCEKEIFQKTVNAMISEGRPFKGCLYFGLMLTKNGPKVIEYNCRFGDPETQVVLPLLDSDLIDIFENVFNGTLDKINIKWKNENAACVILASGGYPEKYEKNIEITGLEKVVDSFVYHAGTKLDNNKILTNGGRVLGVTATAKTLHQALEKAYKDCDIIKFNKKHLRRDIGKKAMDCLK